ncbi:MAG: hypothetical protein H0U90_06580 [Actinobacteria bacterium]|nr:hypothetical protein [Actinomycetota bacterium]
MTTAEKYVTAAYLVVLAVVLLYVVLYAFRMARLARQVDELAESHGHRDPAHPQAAVPATPRARPARVTRQ